MNATTHRAQLMAPQRVILDQPYPVIKAEIILGCPSSGCQGVGICRVMAHGEPNAYRCPKNTAWISATSNSNIRVRFWKSELDSRFIKRHFDGMRFQVLEPYDLSGKLSRMLGVKKVRIHPGVYPVWENPQFLVVDF